MKNLLQKLRLIISSCIVFSFLAAHNARGLVLYWDPTGTTNVGGNATWNTVTSEWSGTSTQSSTLLMWPSTGVLGGSNCAACFCAGPSGSANQGTFTVTLTNAINCAGIFNGILSPGPCTVTLSGTGSLNLLSGLDAFDTYNSLTYIDVPITGPGVITAEESGQFFLNATNTFTGGVALGYSGASFTGIVNFNNSNSFGTGAIGLTNTGGALCALVEETGASGTVITNSWKITPAAGGVNFALMDPSATVTFSGPWALTSNLNIGTGATPQGNIVIISGVMSGAGGLNLFNANTLRLSAANTYTGNTTVSNGVLQLGAAGGIPSGSGKGNLNLTNTGILDVNGFSGSINGFSGSGTVDNTSASVGTLTVGNNNATSTFTGTIQNSSNILNITKTGTGTFTLNTASSTYSGNTTISGGTFALGTGNAIPGASAVILNTGNILNMAGYGDTIAALSGGGSVTNNAGGLSLSGGLSPTNFAGYSCFFGTIDQGQFNKLGSGVMSLRQTNFYNASVTFNYQGGVLSVGAGPNRLPTNYSLYVPGGGLFQLDANSQTLASLNGTGNINLGGGTLTVNATSGSYYSGTMQNSELTTNSTAGGHGLRGYYYNNIDMSDLVAVRDDATVNFTNLTLPVNLPSPPYPKTNFISIRWLGQVQSTVAGTYTFTVTSDDGQRLWVNGTNLVDDWVSEGATAKSGSIALAANTRYDIVLEYMNIAGGASTKLAWTPPGDTVSTVIPTDFLYLPPAGNLVISGTSQVTLAGSNTFTGGTTVIGGGTLEASGDYTLGQGDVYVNNNGSLTMDSGTVNSYISSNGDLVINGPNALLNLNYTGTDAIHGFSTNGGTSYLPTGTYGALGSGATFQIGQIIGTGFLKVTASPTTNVLTSSGGTNVYGSSITFTSTITGSAPAPTGTVTFYDGASAIGMAALSGGQATLTVSDLQVATSPHSITAVYNGDAVHIASTSSALTQIVQPLAIAPLTLSVSNKVYDSTVNATLIVSNCTLSGVLANDTNNVHISGGTAAFLSKVVGTNVTVAVTNLTLDGGLSGNYIVSPDGGTTTANITSAPLTITNVTATSRVYNATTNDALNTGSAALVGVLGSDNVILNTGSATGNFTNATVGTNKTVIVSGFTVSGSDAGNYALAQPTGLTANITQASTTNSASSTANPSTPGQIVDFMSTITPIAPGAGTPTGNVTFLTNGAIFSVTALSGGSTTSAGTSNLLVGTNTIIAAYSGDSNFIGSTNTFIQTVGASSPPGALSITRVGGNTVLNWSGSFTLQSSTVVKGTNSGFADLPGPVTTGPYTNTNTAATQYFRLRN